MDAVVTAHSAPAPADEAARRAAVDASMSGTVLFFFGNALLWLFFGTLFGAMVFFKLRNPEHLSSFFGIALDFLNYGKVYPAFVHMWIYGWCFQASFGVVFWMTGRLTRSPLHHPFLVQVGGFLWNLSVTVGIVAILAGANTGFDWLEFPPFVTVPMLLAFGILAFAWVDMVRRREEGELYISMWYLIGAFFWFPAIYFAGNLLLVWAPVDGVMSGVVVAWVKQGILGLWFVPVGLALAYFLVPKVLGRPIHSYYLAAFGFWSLALFSPWNSGAQMVGGPIPAWLITTGIAASILLLIPTWVVAFNFHKTMESHYQTAGSSPTLRFVTFGLMAYVFGHIFLALTSLREVSTISQFTLFSYGQFNLMFYAFFSMIAFGAIYFITPRMVGCEWISARMIKWHFILTAYCVATVVVMWCASGFFHGAAINNPLTAHLTGYRNVVESALSVVAAPISLALLAWLVVSAILAALAFSSRRLLVPLLGTIVFLWMLYTVLAVFDWLPTTSLSVLVIPVWGLALAQFIFIFHFILMLFRLGRLTGGPTLLPAATETEGGHTS